MAEAEAIEGEYDYIIVGAGSAGCLLANRLSADPASRVLVLEAGGRDNWIWFHIPVGYLFAIGNPRSDWMFKTEPDEGLNGRSLNYPRGKVIGGSSAINAMVYMRGQTADYDHWRQLGLAGWGWDDVLPYFKQHEDHFLGETELHGGGGEMRVEEPRVRWDSARRVPRRRGAGRHQIRPRLQYRRQRGLLRFPRQPEARPALVGGDARSSSPCFIAPICGSKPDAWSKASPSPTAAPSACAGGRAARHAARAAAARSSLPPARSARRSSCCCPASGRVSICATTASRSSPTGRASAPICRIICSCA